MKKYTTAYKYTDIHTYAYIHINLFKEGNFIYRRITIKRVDPGLPSTSIKKALGAFMVYVKSEIIFVANWAHHNYEISLQFFNPFLSIFAYEGVC